MTTLAEMATAALAAAAFLDKVAGTDLPIVAATDLAAPVGSTRPCLLLQLRSQSSMRPDYETATWDAVAEWAKYMGVDVSLGDPCPRYDDGFYRQVSAVLSLDEIDVRVWDHVGGDFERPPSADDLAAVLLLETAGTEDGA